MFENITPERLKASALAELSGWNAAEGSFANIVVSGVMYEIWQWYTALNGLLPMFYIDETSGEYIDRRCADFGIVRKPGETDEALVKRFYNYLRKPATSGNVYHYEKWALEVGGVEAAKVFPLWNGNGSVKVLLAGPSGGVDGTVVDAAAAHIEAERPIGATVTVESAEPLQINVSAAIRLGSETTPEMVGEAYTAALQSYFKELVFSVYLVNYNRLIYLLMSILGVIDISELTVNGGIENIVVGDEQVPVVGEIEVTPSAD